MWSKNFIFTLIFLLLAGTAYARELIDGTLVTVNNEAILESDLKTFRQRLDKNGMIDPLLLGDKTPDELKKSRKEQLDYLVNEKLLDSEVKRLNLNVTFERVEQEIREVAKRNGMSRTELVAALQNQGVNISDYQNFMKSRIERQSLLEQEITSKIRVSDEDVLAAYAKRNKSDTTTSEFTVAHIFFSAKKGNWEGAESRAKAVLAKLNQGQSFESLAEQHSEDPNFTTGGMLGTFRTGEVNKEIEDGISNLSPGQISGVVKTKNGYHILKLVARKVTSDPKFDKEKEKIRAELLDKAFQKQFRSWLEQKKEESFVRTNAA